MLPLKDDLPTRRFPVVTVGLIAANLIAFFYQLSLEMGPRPEGAQAARAFIFEFGVIPCRLTAACQAPDDFPPVLLTVFTSMFLHGGLFHLGGNMLYLWIFGNNVEDAFGRGRFLGFYLLSGVGAVAAQTLVGPRSETPMIGASGAVSGVLGAYLLMFPYARVLVLLIFGFFIRPAYVPAIVVLGFWVVVQFLNGVITFAGPEGSGVAWWAHIGGFATGMVLLVVARPRRPLGRFRL